MTLPKLVPFCPVCGRLYAALSNHLKRNHNVTNAEERGILLKLGTGCIQIRRNPCPVPGCTYHSSRLDKHLECGHAELSATAIKRYTHATKRKKAVSLLAELRATQPTIPMATSLDIDVEEGPDEVLLSGVPEEEGGESSGQTACTRCRQLESDVQKCRLDPFSKNSRACLSVLVSNVLMCFVPSQSNQRVVQRQETQSNPDAAPGRRGRRGRVLRRRAGGGSFNRTSTGSLRSVHCKGGLASR